MNIQKRLKILESKLRPEERKKVDQYEFTFKDWTLEEIKAVLFNDHSPDEVISKWNRTYWNEHPEYLQYLSVKELKKLERMLTEGAGFDAI